MERIISQHLQFVHREIFCGDETRYLEWTRETSCRVIYELVQSRLGPGEEGSEDSSDGMAWGSFAHACWILPHTARTHRSGTDFRFQESALQFKAMLCMHTLQHFFTCGMPGDANKATSWQNEVDAAVSKCQEGVKSGCDLVEKSKHFFRWRVLCASLAALVKLNDLGASLKDQEHKCLAALQVALGQCLEVGIDFFNDGALRQDKEHDDTKDSAGRKPNKYNTVNEARDFARLLELIQLQCTDLASRMGSSLMNTYFTRAGYLIQNHTKCLDELKPEAASFGGARETKQGTLTKWIKPCQKAGSKRSSNSDDDVEASPLKKAKQGVPAENRVF